MIKYYLYLLKMEAQGTAFSNDDEYDYISNRTGYSIELVEFIIWQRSCYEMENDYWTYNIDKCNKCGNTELYVKEVPGRDFYVVYLLMQSLRNPDSTALYNLISRNL